MAGSHRFADVEDDLATKLRGGYYTPPAIADYLVAWALSPRTRRILEPSAGDGAFVAAIRRRHRGGTVDAVEVSPVEAEKVRARNYAGCNTTISDFFAWYSRSKDGYYDAVLGNPPFIRYQNFPEIYREPAFELMRGEGLRPNRLTNAWAPFIVVATRALRRDGRLAMVVPAELLQVSYAGELREYLARSYSELKVITFRRLVFNRIQQETVLLMGIRGDGDATATISFLELETASSLRALPSVPLTKDENRIDLDHGREKWTQYYLSSRELGLIRELERSPTLTTLGDLGEVDVGIVTGRNDFFILSSDDAHNLQLRQHCLSIVGRSSQIPGLVLRDEEWRELARTNSRCLLLQLGNVNRPDLSPAALQYVKYGETKGYHEGFKCRIRQPKWWNVPSIAVSDAFLLRQIHDGPKIVLNKAQALCTDTIHRVYVRPGVDPGWLAAASMNSLTFAFSEIRGRSYGGGVLELEPNEANRLPFPPPQASLPLADLDLWVRRKDTEQLLDELDRLILYPCGLGKDEARTLRTIWAKLSSRRMGRK